MPTYTTKIIDVTFSAVNGEVTPIFSDTKVGNDGEHLNTKFNITLPSAWSVFVATNPLSYLCVEYVNVKGKSGRSSNISIPNPIGTAVSYEVPRDALYAPETAFAFTIYQDIDGVSTRVVKSNVVRLSVGEGFTAGAVPNPYGHDIIQMLIDMINDVEASALQLGETITTAYRGDRGKTAYDHSQTFYGNPHFVTKDDIGLDQVDNTSDANKPISIDTQDALNLKVDKETGKSLVADTIMAELTEGFDTALHKHDRYVDKNSAITGATKTKITYDAKGLVTAGTDATTADIADSNDKRYVTDADLIVIGNTSGTNTGDQDLSGLMTVTGSNSDVDTLQFDLTPTAAFNIGGLRWNDIDKCLEVKTGTNTIEQINQEQVIYATNKDLVPINNGKAVYISGATGETPSVKLAGNLVHNIAQATIGIATQSIFVNQKGKITTQGLVRGIDTNAWNEGDQLFLDTNGGSLTTTIPTAPATKVFVGIVTKKSAGNGEIFVYVLAVNNLSELSDVHAPLITGGDILKWNTATSRWEVYNVDTALSEITTRGTDVKDPTGWLNNDDLDVSYNPTTRQITLSRPSLTAGIYYYYNGKKTQLSATSSYTFTTAHPNNTTTKYYLYSTDGINFAWSSTVWKFSDIQVAMVPMHRLFALKETHGANMMYTNHEADHLNIGTYRLSGGDLTGVTLGSTTAIERRPTISSATIKDEDLPSTLGSQTSNYCYAYLSGATGAWNYTVDSADILRLSTNQPYYNLFTGGAWTQALMGNNTYTAFWLIAIPVSAETQGQKYRYVWLQGQANGTLAQQQARTSLDLNLGEVTNESPEYVFLAKAIVQYNAGNWNIAQIDRLSGTRFSQTGSPNGNYLSSVSVDGTTITGNGTVASPLVATGVQVADDNAYQTLQDNIDLGNLSDTIRQSSMVSVTGTGVKNGVTLSNPISFKDSGCRVEVLGQTLSNLVTNGDFSNGTTGWTPERCTLSATGNVLTITGINQASPDARTNAGLINGHKYYVSASLLVADKSWINGQGYRIGQYGTANLVYLAVASIVNNTWQKISGIITADATSSALLILAESANAGTNTFQIKQVECIDLTAHYGTGNEPTAAQMDLIAPSWFNGTVNVVNPLVKSLGKNLFDGQLETGIYDPTTISGTLVKLSNATNVRSVNKLRLKPSTQYAIKGYGNAGGDFRYWIVDKNDIILETVNFGTTQGTFTTPSQDCYFVFRNNNGGSVTASWYQLELGSVATTYEPFKSNSLAYTGTLRSVPDSVAVNNETVYTASTWAEWLCTGNFTKDISGITLTGNGSETDMSINFSVIKPSTRYLFLLNVLSNTLVTRNMNVSLGGNVYPLVLIGAVGNIKLIANSTVSPTNTCRIYLGNQAVGNLIKFKDIRVIELPAGSQLEADATNLTADQLASNIPYFQSTGTATLSTVLRDRLYNALGLWKVDRYIASGTGLKQTMATETATVTGIPYVYRNGTTSIETAVIAPVTDWKIPYNAEIADALKADITQGVWITPTLLNSWELFSTAYRVGYFKDNFGFVHLEFTIKTGTSGTIALVLPAEYRPKFAITFPCIGASTTVAKLEINPNGNVTVTGVNASTAFYSGHIIFKYEV